VWSDRAVNSPGLSYFEEDGPIPADSSQIFELIRYGFKSESTIPLLYVCRESYGVASKLYSPAFGTESARPQTYFNFDLDTLYLD
jgi:hypothetical protein